MMSIFIERCTTGPGADSASARCVCHFRSSLAEPDSMDIYVTQSAPGRFKVIKVTSVALYRKFYTRTQVPVGVCAEHKLYSVHLPFYGIRDDTLDELKDLKGPPT